MSYPDRGKIFVDHDGTLTDAEKLMGEYSAMVIEYHQHVLGISFYDAMLLMDVAKMQIKANPERYGWQRGAEQTIVAPATSDHFVFNQVATVLMLDFLVQQDPVIAGKVEKLGGKESYVDTMFQKLHRKLGVTYRPESREFVTELQKMQGQHGWAVVTNSEPEKVLASLQTLKLGFEPQVFGGARKYEFNRGWKDLLPVGPYKEIEGFPQRGVELQRETFYRTLLHATAGELNGLAFVEDIAEFVLWLDYLAEHNPDFSEVRTVLLLTVNTPEWERKRYTDGNPTRFGSPSLLKILAWMKGL